ncbi:MAG: hypothetical protein ACQKBT_00815, partial [Puniceicoccales bacterium]
MPPLAGSVIRLAAGCYGRSAGWAVGLLEIPEQNGGEKFVSWTVAVFQFPSSKSQEVERNGDSHFEKFSEKFGLLGCFRRNCCGGSSPGGSWDTWEDSVASVARLMTAEAG